MHVLVTGAAGFIGSTLSDRLLEGGHEVTGVDAFRAAYGRGIQERNLKGLRSHTAGCFLERDLAVDDLTELYDGVDAVVHLAARTSVRGSWGEHFADYARDNVLATQRLLDAARGRDLGAWIYASSASVYGNDVQGPVGEDELPAPHSPYGVTKLAAEHLAHLYRRNYGLPTLSLRLFSVYGPRERPDKAIQIFLEAARDGRGITVLGDGSQHRDFTFVADAVDAIAAALDRAPVGETLNVARGRTLPLSAVIEAIRVVTGRSLAVRYETAAAGDVRVTAARIDRARRVLGYDPTTDLEEGIRRQWAHVLMGPGTSPV